jgi:CHAD domain-containing protein
MAYTPLKAINGKSGNGCDKELQVRPMSYRFEQESTLCENISQIAAEQVDLARNQLLNPPDNDVHEGIHEARKCFKRLRGLVRMARPALGEESYQRENTRFRDTARSLSTARDAQALIESFDLLEEAFGRQVNFSRMLPLRLKLSERRERVVDSREGLQENVDDVVATLDNAATALEHWPLENASTKELASGLHKVYRRARKGWKRVLNEHDPERLHDWRKRAKYLRYHFQLLKGVDRHWAGRWHRGFKRLSDILGDHHDLEVLRKELDQTETNVISAVAESEFRVLLRQHQDALYHEALQLGEVLLKNKPKEMRKHVSRRLGQIKE